MLFCIKEKKTAVRETEEAVSIEETVNPTRYTVTVPQLSWLERYTDNVEVGSSSLPGTTNTKFKEILEIREFNIRN